MGYFETLSPDKIPFILTKDKEKLRAVDVLNWDYLVAISEKAEGRIKNLKQAIAGFAYDFTSTANDDIRDQMLLDFLKNGTANVSRKSAEDFVRTLAHHLQSDYELLRKYAKENGIRLQIIRI